MVTMDSFKLAELLYEGDLKRSESKEMLKKMDPSACLSDELQIRQSGYNCLHLSMNINDVKLTEQLLEQGTDLFKQGTYNGYTPLLAFVMDKPYHQNKKIDKFFGKLGKQNIVDLLLSEQIKKNNALNPKDFTGMSHLHVACMFDHCQAVELFLKAGESVNQIITEKGSFFCGWSPLQFAIKYSSTAVAKHLLYHGADIHLKDDMGHTPLHRVIKLLINATDYIIMGKRALATPLVREVEKLDKIVGFILHTRTKNEVNFMDDIGFSAFHVACTLREPLMAQDILKGDIDINKPINSDSNPWSGWTALHFASCCNIETVKVLVKNRADITIKNKKGETPLDLCMRRYSPGIIHSILSMKEEFREILLSDGTTKLLDLILAMDNCDEFNKFLQNLADIDVTIPFDSPIWPGYNVFHLAISMNEKTQDPKDYVKNLVNPETEPKYYTCTEDEEKSYWKRIVVCLARRCSLTTKNADGMTPLHLAFKLRKVNVVDKLLNCCMTNEVNFDNNLSFLHMACAVGKKNVVERFVNDINVPIKKGFVWFKEHVSLPVQTNSTPLHIAAIFDHRDIIEYLLQKNANPYAKDTLGFTPMHLSTISQPISYLFLGKIANLKEVVSLDGLSHLHVAASANDDTAIEVLVQNGANVNVMFCPLDKIGFLDHYTDQTPLHIAVKQNNMKAVCALIQAGANIHAASPNSKDDSPLQAVMTNKPNELIHQFVKKLRRDKRTNEPIEPCGVTLLHFACAVFDLKWAKKLLEKGADPNAQISMDKDYDGYWKGLTPLHVLLLRASYVTEKLKNLTDMVRLLLRHGADVTLQAEYGFSPMLLAEKIAYESSKENKVVEDSEPNDEGAIVMFSIADIMLKSQKSYSNNPTTYLGSTHFHYACKRNKVEIVEKFLKNGIDVNHARHSFWAKDGGFTPLHYAFAHNSLEVAWLLLEHNADVKAKDLRGNTPLHTAVDNNVDDVVFLEKMCSAGADVKDKNFDGATPLEVFLCSNDLSYNVLKFFLDRGCSLDMDVESNVNIIGLLMKNADPYDREDIFKLLFESCNLIEHIKSGFNAIKSFVGFAPDIKCSEHRRWTVDMYLGGIQLFIDMGCELDQQNTYGITALHEAAMYCNTQAVEALLLLGANINIIDCYCRTPLTFDLFKVAMSDPEWASLATIFANHVWKMKFVGLKIHSTNALIARSGWEFLDIGIKQRCKDELKKLEQTKVGQNWTMVDFLSESKAVMKYQTMSLAQRQSVDEIFKAHADLRKKFPEFCGLLMMQYRKALSNVKAFWSMKNAIVSLLKLELPDNCLNALFRYLEKAECRNLNVASESVAEKL